MNKQANASHVSPGVCSEPIALEDEVDDDADAEVLDAVLELTTGEVKVGRIPEVIELAEVTEPGGVVEVGDVTEPGDVLVVELTTGDVKVGMMPELPELVTDREVELDDVAKV